MSEPIVIKRHKGYATEMDLRLRLRDACDTYSQRETAKRLGFSRAFIGDVLHGRREVTQKLAAAMGYEMVILFRPQAK